jgi:hypothetical protein
MQKQKKGVGEKIILKMFWLLQETYCTGMVVIIYMISWRCLKKFICIFNESFYSCMFQPICLHVVILLDKKVNQKDRITQQKTMCLSTA